MPDDQVVRDALVKIAETEETNITINRFRPNGEDVEEVSVDVPDPEGVVEEVEQEVEDVADEVEAAETVEDVQTATGVEFDPEDVDPTVEEQEEAPPTDVEPEETFDVLEEGEKTNEQIARSVVEQEGITTTDFVTFRSALLNQDVPADEVSDLWDLMKEEGRIEGGDSPNATDEDDEPSEPPVEGDFDELVLLTTTGCPGCERAKEMLGEWIPDVIEVLNVQESDRALDLWGMNDLPVRAPMLLKVWDDGTAERV